MSFIEFYDLKDDTKLPPSAYFKDPRDFEVYTPTPKASLDDFLSSIEESRSAKGFPPISPVEFRILVVSALYQTTSQDLKSRFFERRAVYPQFSHFVQLTKSIVSQIGRDGASYQQRLSRAEACLSCPAHTYNKLFSSKIKTLIQNTINLVSKQDTLNEFAESDMEKAMGSCSICGCSLQNKIKISPYAAVSSLKPIDVANMLTMFGIKAYDRCWILKEAMNDNKLFKILETKVPKGRDTLSEFISLKFKQTKSQANKQTNEI